MKCKLSDICDYAKDKIYVSVLDENTYISTENMMPNKGGITKASTLPAILQTQSFSIGDVLVSNIRPYFKKIWLAEYNGGCSNDVLVFRARNEVSNRFLYYVLADDAFFDYSMTTSKGTKMPRGDKDAIMKYDVPNFKYEEQEKIAAILGALDDKIELNQKINDNLERQAQNIFKSWFVDFEPFGGSKPDDWAYVTLSEISKISTTVFSPQKNPNVLVEHYSIPAYDESHYPVFEMSDGIKSNKYKITNNSVIISKLNPETKRIWRPYCLSDNSICSTEFIVYEPLSSEYRDFVYSVIDSDGFSKFLCSHTTGSTNSRQRATPSVTLNYKAVLPDSETLKKFCAAVSPMYDMVEKNILESQKLAKIRDSLLPRLMSGELDVSKIEL